MFEYFLRYIAPHFCIACRTEGSLLCADCSRLIPPGTTCYAATDDVAQYIMSATKYDDPVVRELVRSLKFDRAKEAATCMTTAMHQRLPVLPPDMIVVHIPTANSRVRQRGYDQASLLAKSFAQLRGNRHVTLLARLSNARQLGSTAAQRQEQVKGSLVCTRPTLANNKTVVLIDDIVTTGATMREAQRILALAGARSIVGYCFAFAPPTTGTTRGMPRLN